MAMQATAAFDVPCAEGAVGVQRRGTGLHTVLALAPPPAGPVVHDGVPAGPGLPLSVLTGWLRRPAAAGSAVSVITCARRWGGAGPVIPAYRELLGPLTVTGQRAVYLLLRTEAGLDRDAAAAVRRCRSATRLLTGLLGEAGVAARPLTAAQVGELSRTVGLAFGRVALETGPAAPVRPLALGVADPSGALEAVWAAGPGGTTALTISGGPDRVRLHACARSAAHAYSTGARLPDGAAPPAPAPESVATESAVLDGAVLDAAVLDTGLLPIGGAGPLVGADGGGRPVTLPLSGPEVPRSWLLGDEVLARRIAVRLAALGIAVCVHTDSPQHWAGLLAAAGRPDLLRFADSGPAQVVLHEGAAPPPQAPGATVLRLLPADADAPPPADPALIQTGPGAAIAAGAGRSLPLRLVRGPAEDRLLADR